MSGLGLLLDQRVVERISAVQLYIESMRLERLGLGPEAMTEADATAQSFVDAMAMLFTAERVWIDGGTGYSFGGVLRGGIVFGMIARPGPSVFDHPPLDWSFHS